MAGRPARRSRDNPLPLNRNDVSLIAKGMRKREVLSDLDSKISPTLLMHPAFAYLDAQSQIDFREGMVSAVEVLCRMDRLLAADAELKAANEYMVLGPYPEFVSRQKSMEEQFKTKKNPGSRFPGITLRSGSSNRFYPAALSKKGEHLAVDYGVAARKALDALTSGATVWLSFVAHPERETDREWLERESRYFDQPALYRWEDVPEHLRVKARGI